MVSDPENDQIKLVSLKKHMFPKPKALHRYAFRIMSHDEPCLLEVASFHTTNPLLPPKRKAWNVDLLPMVGLWSIPVKASTEAQEIKSPSSPETGRNPTTLEVDYMIYMFFYWLYHINYYTLIYINIH